MNTSKLNACLVRVATAVILYIFALTMGCAERPLPPALPPPLPEDVRGQLGRVGIVSARFSPELLKHETPAKGLWRGVGRGAKEGALGGAVLGAHVGSYPIPLLGAVLLAPVGAVAGGVYAAATAESAATVEQAESTIKTAMGTLELSSQTTMAEHVLQEGVGEPRYSVRLASKLGREQWGDEIDFSSLSAEGIDTALEISVINVGLWDTAGYYNAPLQFRMKVHTYLTRTRDRTVLWEYLWPCEGVARKFTEWGTDDARPLRQEIDRCFDTLAHNIVQVLFVEKPAPPR